MSLNALSAAIAKTDIASGDDAMAIIRALRGLTYGVMAKALSGVIDATAADMERALRVCRFDDMASRLEALPDAPGGTSKVLATFSAGAAGVPPQQTPDATIMADLDDLESLGLMLPKETWLYTYETSSAPGNASNLVLMSPTEIAKVRADCPLAYTQDGIDYYARTIGEGKEQKTTYVAVYQSEGAYCVKDSDISDLSSDLETQVGDAIELLTQQGERLSGISDKLMRDVQQDLPFMKLATEQQERHDERHVKAFQDQLQDTPSASSDVRKG